MYYVLIPLKTHFMKRRYFLQLALYLIVTISANHSHAQYNPDKIGKDELYVSEGIVTVEEINGWDGKGGFSGYVSMPSVMSHIL